METGNEPVWRGSHSELRASRGNRRSIRLRPFWQAVRQAGEQKTWSWWGARRTRVLHWSHLYENKTVRNLSNC